MANGRQVGDGWEVTRSSLGWSLADGVKFRLLRGCRVRAALPEGELPVESL